MASDKAGKRPKKSADRAGSAKDGIGKPIDQAFLLHELLKLTNRLMAPFSTHLADRYKISVNEFRLLMTIGNLGTTASHELAEMTGVNVMSVSRAVSTLERHGRIHVTPDPQNRRRKSLKLTAEGRRLYEIMRPQTLKVSEYLFSELSNGELSSLDRIVAKLIDTLEATDEQGKSLFLERTKPDDPPRGRGSGSRARTPLDSRRSQNKSNAR